MLAAALATLALAPGPTLVVAPEPSVTAASRPNVALAPGPTLFVQGHTLVWSAAGRAPIYRVNVVGQRRLIRVRGTQYVAAPQPGMTVTYRVRGRRTAWSNSVSIAWPGEGPAGTVKYRLNAASYFDRYSSEEAWITAHVARILAYPTFGDRYVNMVATLSYHDNATEGYAPLTPTSIQAYVSKVRRDARVGYAGPFVDDVNWTPSFRDWSQSRELEPEKHEMADLIEAIRAAQPNGAIEMNSQFADIWPLMKTHDPDVERALAKVDVVTKEFGVGPSSGISSARDYREFIEYVDTLHAKGIHVVVTGGTEESTAPRWMEYNEATYFLINSGGDFIDGHQQTPQNWWPGFDVSLGSAVGSRERSSSGLWTRRFSGGVVYAVEPGGATQTITLGRKMKSVEWGEVESVRLNSQEGAVLVG